MQVVAAIQEEMEEGVAEEVEEGVPAMNAAEIQVPPSLGLGLGAGSRVGDLVPHLPRRGANRPAAGSHWVRRLPAPQRAPNVPHHLIDN